MYAEIISLWGFIMFCRNSCAVATQVLLCFLTILVNESRLMAIEPQRLELTEPLPFQIVQREGFEPKHASVNTIGGPELGYADIKVRAKMPEGLKGDWEFRLVLTEKGYGRSYGWMAMQVEPDEKLLKGLVEVPAGGPYQLEIRCRDGETIEAIGSVEAIGVGEVFVVAGQSYAGGYNDEIMKVTEPSLGVTTYDWQAKKWRVAHDPPPHNGDGGSIWPPLGDLLVPVLRVPVGFVNVSVGATSTTKWHPEGPLHKRLVEVGKEIGFFRAVLWQQGESDVIEKTSIAQYAKNMRDIRQLACDEWGFDPPWLLAKSTVHPTVYNDPREEGRIRDAIDQLWKQPGFRPGPDTDVLGGDNRGDAKSRRHFSAIGQRRAALLWFAVLWHELHREVEEQ